MTGIDTQILHPHVPFLYAMTTNFFEIAKENLDSVLQAIDGYRELETDQHGRPAPPEHVMRKLSELPGHEVVGYVGDCLTATTNLGLAYVHAFRILSFLTQNKDVLPVNASKPHLAKLFDRLPSTTRQALSDIYNQVNSHDLELEIRTEALPQGNGNNSRPGAYGDFRSTLAYWQSMGMMHESHRSLSGVENTSSLCVFIPLRSLIVLDKIIAGEISPKLDLTYETIAQRMSNYAKGPKLSWDNGKIYVSLPKKLGRTLDARWKPGITSVIRIREAGVEEWSPGFETPFNVCTFVGLKPDTEYDLQVTHKNDAGESDPTITSITTTPK